MMGILTVYSGAASAQQPLLNPVLYQRPVSVLTGVICIVVFLIIRFGKRGGGNRSGLLERAVSCGCYDRDRIRSGQFWRLFTVGFTHIEGWHIAVNLYSLYALSALEEAYGHLWFATILGGSVIGGSLLELAISRTRYSVGLSGGLYGLMFSYALLVWTYGGNVRSILATILINLAINFAPGIAWQAHIGGALSGLVLTQVMLYAAR